MLKTSVKKILKSHLFLRLVGWLAHKYILFVHYTGRWDIRGIEHMQKLESSNKPFIIAFWHGRLLMTPPMAPKVDNLSVLISKHKDGELISQTLKHFNYNLIRGSSGKDGTAALRSVLKVVKKGGVVVITPDGPRGPRMRVSGAIIKIAQLTSLPILPLSFSSSKAKILNSWDRFVAAKPFSKGCYIYGDIFYVDKHLDDAQLEKAGIELENRLNNISKEADEAVGIEVILPAEQGKEKRKKKK